MTPSSFLQLNMYFWLAKTCRINPNAEGFARVYRVHYQPKKIMVRSSDCQGAKAEPQYRCYIFAYCASIPSPVVAYKNKWVGGLGFALVLQQGPPSTWW